jgi:hypothetical protein
MWRVNLADNMEGRQAMRPLLITILSIVVTGCTLVGEQIPLTPTPDLPSVTFRFPENNAQVFENAELPIELLATDVSQGISRVELYVDTLTDAEPYQTATPVEAETVPVFTARMNWLARGIGRHQLTAVAYRADGIQSDEQILIVEVIPRPGAGDSSTEDATAMP